MKFFNAGILLITALVACISCSKGELDNNESDSEIRFNQLLTKADYTGNEFRVFAQYAPVSNNQWYDLMENERVYKSSLGYIYDNTRYWIRNSDYIFVGVSPYVSSWDIIPDNTGYSYSFDISVPPAANTDYMVASTTDSVDEDTDLTDKAVPLEFNHCLAMLNFKVNKEVSGHNYFIKQISLSGISRTGTVNVPFSRSNSFSIEAKEESRQITRQGLEFEVNGGLVLGDNDGLLVIPQQQNNVKLSISFDFKQTDTYTETYITEKPIPANIAHWEAGKKYTYTLTIGTDKKIYISTPTVESWGVAQSGGTIIIK